MYAMPFPLEPILKAATEGFSAWSQEVAKGVQCLQTEICSALNLHEPKTFKKDLWRQEAGGGGLSCVLEEGEVFEKGGVLFSAVCGPSLPPIARKVTSKSPAVPAGTPFFATGVSLILHPHNPYVPTVHFNVRYIEVGDVHWFGGGIDLTPYYPFAEDCIHFHQTVKICCDRFDTSYYPRFKAWCDEYFFLKHRDEARGIGGIFFNHLSITKKTGLEFVQALGKAFLQAYLPIVQRHHDKKFGLRQRDFQLQRRGRYVEFNLLYDQGTLFGLQSNGRIESILVSMPPRVNWRYDWQPAANSIEATLYTHFLPPTDWAGEQGREKLALLSK